MNYYLYVFLVLALSFINQGLKPPLEVVDTAQWAGLPLAHFQQNRVAIAVRFCLCFLSHFVWTFTIIECHPKGGDSHDGNKKL